MKTYYIHAIKDGIQVNRNPANALLSFEASDKASKDHTALMHEAREAIAYDVLDASSLYDESILEAVDHYPLPINVRRDVIVRAQLICARDSNPEPAELWDHGAVNPQYRPETQEVDEAEQ